MGRRRLTNAKTKVIRISPMLERELIRAREYCHLPIHYKIQDTMMAILRMQEGFESNE